MLPPRLDLNEIEYFEQFMKNKVPGSKMVEWGSGGSTAMFIPYFSTGSLISIEHNKEWFDKVIAETRGYDKKYMENFEYLLCEPEHKGHPVDIRFYGYGVPYEENPCFASTYINPETPDRSIFDADIYFVDGICRGAVLATIAVKAKKRDAAIFIHDYFGSEERGSWYAWASNLYGEVRQVGSTLARLHL